MQHITRRAVAGAVRTVFTAPISRPSLDLSGKVVLVTGSTQGLGAGIVRALVECNVGGVVIHGRDTSKGSATTLAADVKAAGVESLIVSADLAEEDDCVRLVAQADAAFGRLDGLVNAAGCTFRGGLWNSDADLWQYMFNVRVAFRGACTVVLRRC